MGPSCSVPVSATVCLSCSVTVYLMPYGDPSVSGYRLLCIAGEFHCIIVMAVMFSSAGNDKADKLMVIGCC